MPTALQSPNWLKLAAALGALAVVIGAFGAHGVDSYFADKYAETPDKTVTGMSVPASWKYMQDYKTGVDYHFYHVVGLLAVGLLAQTRPSKSLQVAGWSFLTGILLFSGSLYALTLSGQTWLGAIAPIGGTAFIVGWLALAHGACRKA